MTACKVAKYQRSELPRSKGLFLSESVVYPTYSSFVIAFRVGGRDEPLHVPGIVNVIKDILTMELR